MNKIFLTSILLLVICLNIILIYDVEFNHKNQEKMIININDYEECRNLNYIEVSVCLRDYIKTFYNYTVREDTEKSLEDIKTNGGDCYDYSILYEKLAKSLGHPSITTPFYGNVSGHRIAIIYSNDMSGYCILDQLNVNCQELG